MVYWPVLASIWANGRLSNSVQGMTRGGIPILTMEQHREERGRLKQFREERGKLEQFKEERGRLEQFREERGRTKETETDTSNRPGPPYSGEEGASDRQDFYDDFYYDDDYDGQDQRPQER